MPTKPKILIVEDNESVMNALSEFLVLQGFDVCTAAGQTDAMTHVHIRKPDLALVDIVLQDGGGHSLFQEIRRISDMPVIFLTGQSEDTERIIGLEIGADDYVTKPFNPRELTARIKAVLRRSRKSIDQQSKSLSDSTLYFGDCSFNPLTHELINPHGETVSLNKGERSLLIAFLESPHEVLSRDRLLDATHAGKTEVFDRSIDNLVSRLRKKLEHDPKTPRLIKTFWGGGYSLSVDVTSTPPVATGT